MSLKDRERRDCQGLHNVGNVCPRLSGRTQSEDEGFRVLLSAEGKRTMNFSYETGLDFYLGSEICPVNFEAMQEYCDKFCVDDEVDRLRQYRSFREQCSIRGMLEEVEKYHSKVKGALCRARMIVENAIDNQ